MLRENAGVPAATLSTAECRDWLGSAARGNPWIYRAGRGEIEIAPLVSPLRFDVTVRRAFFDFYADRRDLYRSDFTAFAELARGHDYYVWFTRVMCRAWQPHVLDDERLLAAAWEERLHAAAGLFDSFERRGFDERFPIVLYEGRHVLPTVTGKRVSRTVYAGDGNHRLALLMAAGHTTLQPSHYRIKRFRRLIPSDTTPRLVAALRVDRQRYLAFLRTGYPSLRFGQAGGRIEITDAPDAATEAEVRGILRIDRWRSDEETNDREH
jgi:hypothetical protein